MIGYGICGSYCTHARTLEAVKELKESYELLPIFSYNVLTTDTRFGAAEDFIRKAEELCGRSGVKTIAEAEPLGPAKPMDAMIIAPCTGNTLAKLACGITDTPVTMAAKAHLRTGRPLVICLATNDAMSGNLKNIAVMMEKKNVFFVPMVQDDPVSKPFSLVADFALLPEALARAMEGVNLRPVFLEKR